VLAMLRRPAERLSKRSAAAKHSLSVTGSRATLGWTKYVDQAIGIDSFGMSAPGSYVMNYFNINAATLVAHVLETLGGAR